METEWDMGVRVVDVTAARRALPNFDRLPEGLPGNRATPGGIAGHFGFRSSRDLSDDQKIDVSPGRKAYALPPGHELCEQSKQSSDPAFHAGHKSRGTKVGFVWEKAFLYLRSPR